MTRATLVSLVAALVATAFPATAQQPQTERAWKGTVSMPPSTELEIGFRLMPGEGGGWVGLLSMPSQKLKDAPVRELRVDEHALAFGFDVPSLPDADDPRYEFEILDSGSLSGTMSLTGMRLDATLAPVGAAEAPREADEPQPGKQPVERPVAPAADPERVWSGGVAVSPERTIGIVFRLSTGEDGQPVGLLSIPEQGLNDTPVSELAVAETGFAFVLALPSLPEAYRPSFELTLDEGGSLSGTMTQSGMTFPMTMSLSDEAALRAEREALRPQTPRPPFPYRTEEVTVPVATDAGAHTLAGTLTLPAVDSFGEGPYPTVVFITGSGAQDRDETIFEHKPFAVLADHLARHGIASLRCDDRGVFGSTGDPETPTTHDFVDDARAQVDFLLPRAEIGPIGLIGHSEGAVVGPMLAADDADVKFVVMLAGTGVPGAQVLIEQTAAILAASGLPPEQVAAAREAQTEVLTRYAAGEDPAQLHDLLVDQITNQTMVEFTDEQIEQAVAQAQAQLRSPWLRAFVTLDPCDALRKVTQPVLVLNGGMDLQVLNWQNVPEIEKALANNPGVTVRVFEGLNHLFQPSEVGTVAEYTTIKTTIAPEVLEVVTEWVLEHTKEQ